MLAGSLPVGASVAQLSVQASLCGRVVAGITAAVGEDVGMVILASGLVRAYDGQTRRAPWC